MPSPIAHSVAGYGYYRWRAGREPAFPAGLWQAAVFVLFANAPDLHYLPGILAGEPGRFRFGYLHSFGFLAGASALLYAVLEFTRNARSAFWTAHFAVLYGLHVVMDFFTRNLTPNSGLALFWPASLELFTAPLHLFVDLKKKGWDQVLGAHNFLALGREALFAVAVLAAVLWMERRRAIVTPPEKR